MEKWVNKYPILSEFQECSLLFALKVRNTVFVFLKVFSAKILRKYCTLKKTSKKSSRNKYSSLAFYIPMCQETELHLEGGLDHVVGSVDGLGSSETCSSQLSIIKNRYLDTKISLLRCLGAELHLQVALDHVVGVHQFWNLFQST